MTSILIITTTVLLLSAATTTTTTSSLSHPTVILISSDAFRFDYLHKTTTLPTLHSLLSSSTSSPSGLIPVFPTLTFPNHYSIATGLYPPHHGIIDNHFSDPSISPLPFSPSTLTPSFWLGHPIWETVVDHGYNAATFFWPGSQVHKGSWTCPPKFCQPYNSSIPFENRVDSVLSYFDLTPDNVPALITLYFEEPDWKGHAFGPDDVEVTGAVVRIDQMVGRLVSGLERRGVYEEVTLILLGDHGMVGICRPKYVFLDDLKAWIEIEPGWVQSYSPLFALRPPPGVSAVDVVERMNEGLGSGEVKNGEYLKVFLKEELPERLHYSDSYRIPPIIGLLDEGYKVAQNRSSPDVKGCGGDHGYDNGFLSMRSIFIAHGPRFQRGREVPSFENVEIYNLIAAILGLKGAPNNGSDSFVESILLPSD